MGIFDSLRSKKLRVSKRAYALQKDRPTGERELFELACKSKQEVSWAHIMGIDTWLNLTQDYQKTMADNAVKYQVTSRPLANSMFDANIVFYHTHPNKAFTSALKMMTKRPRFDFSADPMSFLSIEQKAYGYLLSTFHLPSVQDIETAAYLEEKHGPGIFHIIVSKVGATITRIKNPPDKDSDKISVDELVSRFASAHNSIPEFNPNTKGAFMNPHYGVINELCDGRIKVVDLTSVASLKFSPEDHTLMRWLSCDAPVKEQFRSSGVMHIMQVVDSNTERWNALEKRVDRLTEIGDNGAELEKLSKGVHQDVAKVLTEFVGQESASVYADYSIRAMRDFYTCIDDQYLKG